jgi:hypothetical protein
LSELTPSGPVPAIADEESPDASRATGAPLKVLQEERERLQLLLVPRERRKWLRECLRRLLLRLLFWRPRSGESNTDKSRREVALTKQQRRVLRDPEVRKNVEILAARVCDAIDLNRRRSLPPADPLPQEVTNRLFELLCEPLKALCLETLLDTRRSVEELLIEHSDLLLLQQRTAEEYAEEEATLLTWRRFYGGERPELLNLNYCSESPSEQVQKSTKVRLQCLVAARFSLYRPLRARRRLRIIYLRYFGPVLLLAGLLFGLAIGFQHHVGVRVVLLATAAGAAGAALSGLLKFRDEVRLGAQVREFLPFYLVQVEVGAVFGLFIDLVFAAGWLRFAPSAAGIGVLAFAAGFSEPFAVGIVAKMTERA